MKLKLRSVGTSTGVLLPKEMLIRMKVKKDDTLFAGETPEGYLLTPYDPDVEEQLAKGRGFMAKHRAAFRALAKCRSRDGSAGVRSSCCTPRVSPNTAVCRDCAMKRRWKRRLRERTTSIRTNKSPI